MTRSAPLRSNSGERATRVVTIRSPGGAALPARLLDHSAVPAAPRAGAREGEEALVLGGHAAAAALGTDDRSRPRLRARAVAGRTGRLELDRDLRRQAFEGVLEGEVDRHLDVGAPLPARTSVRGGAPAAHPSEEPAEQVAQIPEVADVARPLEVAAARRAGPGEEARPDLVVLLALLRIGEDVVGALDLLEALLRLRIPRVRVRVVLAGQLAVRLLDLGRGRGLGDSENLVEIPHADDAPWEITTRAGRTTRSPRR